MDQKKINKFLYGTIYASICVILLFGFIGIQNIHKNLLEKKVYSWITEIVQDDENHRIQVSLGQKNMEMSIEIELYINKENSQLEYRFTEDESYETLFQLPESIKNMTNLFESKEEEVFEIESSMKVESLPKESLLTLLNQYIDNLKVNSSLFSVDKMSFQFDVLWMDQQFQIKISEISERV